MLLALLAALRRRLEDHMSRAPLRFSGRLLGVALNALAKAREFDDIGEEEETRLFDLAERLVLIKAEEADAFDMVSMSHIAHAYTAVITRPAPPLASLRAAPDHRRARPPPGSFTRARPRSRAPSARPALMTSGTRGGGRGTGTARTIQRPPRRRWTQPGS